jgi:sugar phosphate isomerase/epimerase
MNTPEIRLSAVITGFFPESVTKASATARAIELCAKLGFDTVEFFYEGEEKELIGRACRSTKMSSIFLPALALKRERLDLGDPDERRRREAVEHVRRWIDDARLYGADSLMLVSGPERSDQAEREEAMANLTDALIELCGYACGQSPVERIGIRVESFNNNGEPWLLIGPPDRCSVLAADVTRHYGNFGLTMDLSHILQMGLEPIPVLESVASWCSHLHLANCVIRDRQHPLFGDKHPEFGYPAGELDEEDLAQFISRLFSSGFVQDRSEPITIGIEVITREGHDPYMNLQNAKSQLDRALKRIQE